MHVNYVSAYVPRHRVQETLSDRNTNSVYETLSEHNGVCQTLTGRNCVTETLSERQ